MDKEYTYLRVDTSNETRISRLFDVDKVHLATFRLSALRKEENENDVEYFTYDLNEYNDILSMFENSQEVFSINYNAETLDK